MWKKQDDAVDALFASDKTPDLTSLGDALIQSLTNEQAKKAGFAVVPEKVLAEDQNQPLPLPTMKTYTDAMNEFTKYATAFIEQLPLLTKARTAYKEAMKASAEMRKVLDNGDQKLRTLMTRMEEQGVIQVVTPDPDKKKPETEKLESIKDGSRGRSEWP
jgi:hypothetical protein